MSEGWVGIKMACTECGAEKGSFHTSGCSVAARNNLRTIIGDPKRKGMSSNNGNGVIRVGRKGKRKFAFGEDGAPFEVDVVVAFQQWVCIDDEFRERSTDRIIATADMPAYHQAAVAFVSNLAFGQIEHHPYPEGAKGVPGITTAEALDFIARLREQYDEVAAFFQPRSRDEPESPGTSEAELRFSEEPAMN